MALRMAVAGVMLIIVGQALDRLVTSSIAASPARISMDAPIALTAPSGSPQINPDSSATSFAAWADAASSTSLTASSITLSAAPPPYVMTTTLRRNEDVYGVLQRLRVDGGPALARTLRHDGRTEKLRLLRPGDELQVRYDDQRQLTALIANLDDRRRPDGKRQISVARGGNGRLVFSDAFRPHDIYWRLRSGSIQKGFFSSMSAVGVPGQVVADAMRIFRDQIDFRQAFRAGDEFHIIYQQSIDTTRPVGVGRILAIALQAGGQWHRAVWHEPLKGNGQMGEQGAYYAFDGAPLRTSAWIAPIGNARTSSTFGARRHPISGRRQRHDGIDLVAPVGTPVLASAMGIVESAGWQRGYGRVVVLRHMPPYSTYYAHLSDIAPYIKVGAKVAQGQPIGAVGRSGDTTGAHLHFEVRTRNRPIDPMLALLDSQPPLADRQLVLFRASSAALVEQIARMQAAANTVQSTGVTKASDATQPGPTLALAAETVSIAQPRPS